MKTLSALGVIFLFIQIPFSGNSQNQLEGSFFMVANGMTLTFHPVRPNNSFGQLWFEVVYANGQRGSSTFFQNNEILTLSQFNYGQDQSFRIVKYDGQYLLLETIGMYPVQQYNFVKKGQPGNSISEEILVSSGGYNYTTGHFNKAIRFAEFICGTKITAAEKTEAKEEAIADFKLNPANTIAEIDNIDQQMQQLYQLTDIGQIGVARSAFVAQLYPAVQQLDDNRLFKRLINKYTPALSIDQENGLALTQRDVDGFFELNQFYSELYGQSVQLDENTRSQYQNYLVNQFKQGNLQTKQSLCVFGLLNEYLRNVYSQMGPQQKAQFKAGLSNNYASSNYDDNGGIKDYTNPENLWPSGVNTPEEKRAYMAQKRSEYQMNQSTFNIMQDILLQEHATSLNIIESIVPEGDYWEVKYNDY